jgi:uncharacterized membrane protein YhfC
MHDLSCVIAGLLNLFGPWTLLMLWHKRTGARLLPGPVAFAICFPVFFAGAAIRSGFSHDNFYAYYIQQGLLFGIFEEGAKYIALRYILTDYDSRKDAVSYGIGHSAYESFGAGFACFGIIGTGNAASDIVLGNLVSSIGGAIECAAMTVIIFYGIYTNKAKIYLPLVMLIHAFGNAMTGLFGFSRLIWFTLKIVVFVCVCYAAARCYKAMTPAYETEEI